MKSKIYFVETKASEQRQLLCQWVEQLFESGKKVQVAADSSMAAQLLDQLMWSFSQESFVPHCILPPGGSADNVTPVVITIGEKPLEGVDVLVCDSPLHLDFIRRYSLSVHFVLLDDQERRQESRLLWQSARDAGIAPFHIPYSARGKFPKFPE